jgi:uncharacterized protein
MLCPVCKTQLTMSERQGIEIDYCPNCRGVWLDRGELDKLIERSGASSYPKTKFSDHTDNGNEYHTPSSHPNQYNYPYHKKKKESWLGDIFDF